MRAEVEIDDDGINSGFRVPGVGQAKGTTLKNPVTGEEHGVAIVLDAGFIWKRGDCGQGSFEVEAEGIHLTFEDSNWILYDFDWTNQEYVSARALTASRGDACLRRNGGRERSPLTPASPGKCSTVGRHSRTWGRAMTPPARRTPLPSQDVHLLRAPVPDLLRAEAVAQTKPVVRI